MKRSRSIVIGVSVIVLGLAILINRVREPRYQGRTLTEWINAEVSDYQKYNSNWRNFAKDPKSNPVWPTASQAVKQMAPEAIPFLLDWAQAEDSARKEEIIEWINRHSIFHLHIDSASDRNWKASVGFWLLENESRPAWPTLVSETFNTNEAHRYFALECLVQTDPDRELFLPVLTRLTHDSAKLIRAIASRELAVRFPKDAEAAEVYKEFPNLRQEPTNYARPLIPVVSSGW